MAAAETINLPPPEGPAGTRGDLDFARLLHAVLRYKWGILGLAFASSLFTGLWVSSQEPVYRAQASVVLETQEANLVGVEQVYSLGYRDYDDVYTQYEILRSRSLAERVVRRLQLHAHPMYSTPKDAQADDSSGFDLRAMLPARKKTPPPQLSEEELEERAISELTARVAAGLVVEDLEFGYVVYLKYDSTNPQLAADIVNAFAEEFIASNLEVRLSGTVQAEGWLNERLEDLRKSLRQSEQALQSFRESEGLVEVEGITGLGSNELQALARRLDDARKTRIEAQNIKEDVEGMRNATTEELMTVPAVLEHELISELKRAQSLSERRAAELAKRYGPKHPKMIAALSDLEAANQDLAREVRKVVSGINREYEVALRTEQQLQAAWDERKSEMQEFNRIEFRLRELQREVDTNRELYDVFLSRIKDVSETGGFEKPHARILDEAVVPTWPHSPNVQRAVLIALTIGLLAGAGVAVLLDILDDTVRSPDDVESKLNAPLLGPLPRETADQQGGFPQFWQARQSNFAEAIRTIRTGLLLSDLDTPPRVIVVTSTVPGEGKSTLVLNLGAALAQMERTLVIGADLRRPSLAQKLGMVPNHRGLSHFVSGTAELEECIEEVGELGLHVMPAGVIPPNPLEMISSATFVKALDTLREHYDRIVIDSAPMELVSDAQVLASYADSVVYVVKADSTSATRAARGIASLRASNEPLTGVVLNQVEKRKRSGYYGDSYYGYREDGSEPAPG